MAKYIDAEKLVSIFNAKGDMAVGTPKAVFYNAAKIVETLPAIDVVEVKHGKWIEKETYLDIYYDCSVCGESFCFIEGSPTDNSYKYCPNCGTKMDNKGDDNNV